jgi:DNA invertase Pin-like site-specific DNA recombinase
MLNAFTGVACNKLIHLKTCTQFCLLLTLSKSKPTKMNIVKYARVSTTDQNPERQGNCDFLDKCSGSIPFEERPEAKKLLQWVAVGRVKEVRVHSIDRLGRNTLDILQTIKHFTAMGVNVVSEKEGLKTLLPDGKENPVAKMMIGILGTLSEFELERIRERQREGIAKAKAKGVYIKHGGHKPKLTPKQFLNKKVNANCQKYLEQGFSLRMSARMAGVSLGTAQKVSKLMQAS